MRVGGGLFTREELLGGGLDRERRARRVVNAIESRLIFTRAETRRALKAYFEGDFDGYTREVDRDFLQGIRSRALTEYRPGAADFERFVSQWRVLVPDDTEVRAAVLRLVIRRFSLSREQAPASLAALGLDDAEVEAAQASLYGEPLEPPPSSPLGVAEGESEGPVGADPIRAAEAIVQWRTLPGGTVLFRPGDPGDALYVVVCGRLRLVDGDAHAGVASEGEDVPRGGLVGEVEVLTGESRTQLAYAARDSEVMVLPQEGLLAIAGEHPAVMLRVNRDLARRLRDRMAPPRAHEAASVVFALVGHDPRVPLSAAADQLAGAFAGIGPTLHLRRNDVERQFGDPHDEADDAEVIAWLSEQEMQYRFVLYEADAGPSRWTERCLRQADRVVLVAEAAGNPANATIERQIDDRPVALPVDLLLLHAREVPMPRGTAAWLRPRRVRMHLHARLNDRPQMERVARRLTGEAIGVVLGGGGARGFAHLGVLRALEERGVPVDVIGGASMGALLGAGFATGRSSDELCERAFRTAASRRLLLDPTLPFAALFAGGKVTNLLQREMLPWRIEDLWRPFFCVSSNLSRAEEQVHDDGLLWESVRASIAIPGIFPPVLDARGDVLVDGGVLNGLPIDRMRGRPDVGSVIAVNVSPERESAREYRFGPRISGWSALAGRLMPSRRGTIAPTLIDTFMRANEVRTASASIWALRSKADLVIDPPVGGIGPLEFARCASLVETGYRAAGEPLDAWLTAAAPVWLRGVRGM